MPLRRFVRLITQGVSPQAGNSPYTYGQRGLLKLSAVRFGEFRPGENKELDADFDFSRALVPSRGDLLVTRVNTPSLVGDACAVRDPDPTVVLCDLIYLLRLDGHLMAEFAAYVLIGTRSRWELSSLARGTSQSMVKRRGEDVLSVRVPAPPIGSGNSSTSSQSIAGRSSLAPSPARSLYRGPHDWQSELGSQANVWPPTRPRARRALPAQDRRVEPVPLPAA